MIKLKQLRLLCCLIILIIIIIFNRKIHVEITNCDRSNYLFADIVDLTEREIDFDQDVLVLLHIQKTSGSYFEKSIMSDLMIKLNNTFVPACSYSDMYERVICYRNRHLKSFFWDKTLNLYCDVHADYTELKNCVLYEYANRLKLEQQPIPFHGVIHFITMLRDPIRRYISEFQHLKRGATWEKSVRVCNEELLYKTNYKNSKNWTEVTWQEFLSCENNLANNRMTRMLVNYNQLGCRILKCWLKSSNCSSDEKRLHDKTILESAKQTLLSISFFGLAEYQSLSQYLFEKTFKDRVKFSKPLFDLNTNFDESLIDKQSLKLIMQNNHLDTKLYEFAKELFFERVKYFKEN